MNSKTKYSQNARELSNEYIQIISHDILDECMERIGKIETDNMISESHAKLAEAAKTRLIKQLRKVRV